jgi:hypothetical protein
MVTMETTFVTMEAEASILTTPFDVKWPPEALGSVGSRMNGNCNNYGRFTTRINVNH